MSQETFRVRRLDDAALYSLFHDAEQAALTASEGSGVELDLTFAGFSVLGRLDFSENAPEPGNYNIKRANLNLRVRIKDGRNEQQSSVSVTVDRGSETELDTLSINASGNNQSPWQSDPGRASIAAAFNVLSQVIKPNDADPGTAIGQLTNFADNIDRSFRGFTKGVEETLQKLADQRTEEQERLAADRERMRAELSQERDAMLSQARAEIEEARRTLKEREDSLQEREADLLIKSHKDARRQLFDQLQEDLQESVRIPSHGASVTWSRWLIFLGLTGGGIAATLMALNATPSDALVATVAGPIDLWPIYLKQTIWGIAALGAFAGGIQWLRHFYTRDLRVAEDYERFRHDMARASWVIEAALEMQKEHEIDVPERWLTNVTEGLFQKTSASSAVDDGQQALAALLAFSSSVKAGPNGLEVDLGKRGTRKIASAASNSEETS
ncbi:hypothetical protein [Psychromarinibacter sp. S121]|uniref:hypothetical protein n=1 Tax=Psychromarinibacter sp. S121 TaxID=3415127 RepID=UPI003C7BEE32